MHVFMCVRVHACASVHGCVCVDLCTCAALPIVSIYSPRYRLLRTSCSSIQPSKTECAYCYTYFEEKHPVLFFSSFHINVFTYLTLLRHKSVPFAKQYCKFSEGVMSYKIMQEKRSCKILFIFSYSAIQQERRSRIR